MNGERSDFAVVMPAYNEAGRIGRIIADIRKHGDADIVVIDDGSSDGTAEEASAAGAAVFRHPFNLGYGAALQTGYKYALGRGYEWVVQMDADGQHDPAYINALLRAVRSGSGDVVIGSRFLGEGEYRPTVLKRIGMAFFRWLATAITGQQVTDPTSGFQALNRTAMEFYASEAFPTDYPDADVLVMLHRKGLRFGEIPVRMHQSSGKTVMHSGIVPLYYLFKMVLSIIVTLLRRD